MIIASTRISVNVDENVKRNAQKLFDEMGLDMTTAIDLFLRTALIEKRLPFEVRTEQAYREFVYRGYISDELDKSMIEAADPNTKWMSHDEMKTRLANRRKARHHV